MQYKLFCTNSEWLPRENGGIRLWQEIVDVATQDRVFPHYVPNSSIKHSKNDSKDRFQEIL
jgi:hypothetical protein